MDLFKKYVLLKFFIFILATLSSGNILECFDNCKCFWAAERYEADCSYRGLEKYPNINDKNNNVQINTINFSNNLLTEFPYHLSNVIDELEFLDLTNNNIKKLKSNTLYGFNTLRTLFLNGNNLSTWSDINPNTAFIDANNLETLSLADNPITSFSNVDETFLIVSHSIVVLDLSYCHISKLSGEYMLTGLSALERLILNGNPLKILTPLISDTLKVFDLSDCNIEISTIDAFDNLPQLTHLNLSQNNGINLRNKIGEYVKSSSLLLLDLSNCNLDVIDIAGFEKLSTLLFNGNLLKKLTSDLFENNLYIEYLDLSKNSINYIESNTFNNLKLLKKLDLSYNVISKIDSNMFIMNSLLIILNLSQNYLSRFHPIISHSLIHLYLNSNDISKIDSDAISSLKNISILDLSYNIFSTFPNDMESKTLQVLDLSMCRIIKINNRTFSGFPELSKLDLSGNRFTKTFKISYFQNNQYLQEIRLYDNLWECNCNDRDFQLFYNYYLQRRMPGTRLKEMPQCGHPINSIQNTWGQTCKHIWTPKESMALPEKIWSIIFSAILVFVASLCLYSALRRVFKGCKRTYNQRILRRNLSEQRDIRRQNDEILQQRSFPNAPNTIIRESSPPCYEEALLMPKIDRSKSLGELNSTSTTNTSSKRNKHKLQRTSTTVDLENDNNLIVDHNRFLSEERLLDRDKERSASNFGYVRRHQRGLSDGIRLNEFNYDTRFPPAHMKSQNLESAERIAICKNTRSSPYSSRKWKMNADSVSFTSISDDELGIHRNSIIYNKNGGIAGATGGRDIGEFDNLGKTNKLSPYSRRRPRGVSISQLSISKENIYDETPSMKIDEKSLIQSALSTPLLSSSSSSSSPNQKLVVVENHFNGNHHHNNKVNNDNNNFTLDAMKKSSSIESSDFDKIQIPSKGQSIESFNSEIITEEDDITNNSNTDQMVIVTLPIKQSKF